MLIELERDVNIFNFFLNTTAKIMECAVYYVYESRLQF